VKRITNLTVVVVFACLMIAFCAGSVTTFAADGHDAGLCAQCGESNDGHVGAVTVEHNGEHQTFCCPQVVPLSIRMHIKKELIMKRQAITNTKAMTSTRVMMNMRVIIIKED